jgi:serine/alanine racemase
LWYLPAVMLGVILVWALLRYAGLWVATVASGVLYVVGLLGDSYYGFAESVAFLKSFLDGVFAVSNYTRNGLFFAPLFLLVGVWAARLQKKMARGTALAGFLAFFAVMLAEGLLLHRTGVQRHDSMYIALPFCVFFLFSWLLAVRGESSKILRDASLVIYIIHPLLIVLIRGAAKPLGLTGLMVDNSVVHYLLVCVAAAVAAVLCALVAEHFARKKTLQQKGNRAWVQVNMAALTHNVGTLRGLLPEKCALMPALKADAYGLGVRQIGGALQKMGVSSFCVATLQEGIELRKNGLRGEILVLGYTPPKDAVLLRRYRLMQTVVDYAYAQQLQKQGGRAAVHVKIDTGMNRLGERVERLKEIEEIFAMKNLDVKGVYTQLGACDSREEDDVAFTMEQIRAFWKNAEMLRSKGIAVPAPHIQCSYGILNYPQTKCAYVRPGLAVYGIIDERACRNTAPLLKVIFELKAQIALVKEVRKGERIGYGKTGIAREDMRIAVITIGYGDGLPRNLSNGVGGVLVGGEYAPVVGNICMDQAMVDISHIENVQPGDTATLIGHDGGKNISVCEFARQAGTIPNEIVSRFGKRLERVYING